MKKSVLILSSIDWDFLWQKQQTLSVLFAKNGWNVVYVDGTGIASPSYRELGRIIFKKYIGINAFKNPLPEEIKRIKIPIFPPTNKLFLKINELFFLPRLLKRIKGTGIKNPVVIAYLPTHTTLRIIEEIEPSLLIYDCVSNFVAFPGAPEDIKETEEKLIEKSQFITTDSSYLFEKMKKYGKHVFRIPPGVDFELFSRADNGPVKTINKICYFGGIHERSTDISVFLTLSKLLQEKKFLIIGKIQTPINFGKDLDNIQILSPLPQTELVEKLRDCDCFILPYRKNQFVAGVIPSKTYETLATGKPAIASGLEENLKELKEVMYFAKDVKDFERIIKELPHIETPEKYEARKRIAKENSWEKRFKRLLAIIESFQN